VAGFVDSTVKDIDARLSELQDEVKKLEAARAALVGIQRRPGRPRGSRAKAAAASGTTTTKARRTGRRPGRPRGRRSGGGTRGAQALALVQARPGVTIPEIASELKIEPNYLYRVMPGLVKDGSVKKQGKGWHPA
jgi:hypothetical protein